MTKLKILIFFIFFLHMSKNSYNFAADLMNNRISLNMYNKLVNCHNFNTLKL